MILHTSTPGQACQTISTQHYRWSESHVWTHPNTAWVECIVDMDMHTVYLAIQTACIVHIWDNTTQGYIWQSVEDNHTGRLYQTSSLLNILTKSHSHVGTKFTGVCTVVSGFLAPRCILQSHMWLQDGTAELHVNSNGIWHVRLHCSNYSVQCVKGSGNP